MVHLTVIVPAVDIFTSAISAGLKLPDYRILRSRRAIISESKHLTFRKWRFHVPWKYRQRMGERGDNDKEVNDLTGYGIIGSEKERQDNG
jgi:hypothetical protein